MCRALLPLNGPRRLWETPEGFDCGRNRFGCTIEPDFRAPQPESPDRGLMILGQHQMIEARRASCR
jgi:hypothetical protein